MTKTLENKIDFVLLFSATNANPNGDPLDDNRPRMDDDGYGIVSNVCVKRKVRNRLQDEGERIYVQSADRVDDGCDSLKMRADKCVALKNLSSGKGTNQSAYAKAACEEFFDVRTFGQVFAFKGNESLSVGVRGPLTIHQAKSVSQVNVIDMQITKSVNGESGKEGRSSDTMGTNHLVEFGLYVVKGSISCYLAEKTGFSEEDAEKVKEALLSLFENDASNARPEGSMEVHRLYWWKHGCKTPKTSTAKVHRSVKILAKDPAKRPTCFEDYIIELEELPGCVKPEILEGR